MTNANKSSLSRTKRAMLIFPVARIDRQIRKKCPGKRVGDKTPVYFAAILEELMKCVLEGAITKASNQRISHMHLKKAIEADACLNAFFGNNVTWGNKIFAHKNATARINRDEEERRAKNREKANAAAQKKADKLDRVVAFQTERADNAAMEAKRKEAKRKEAKEAKEAEEAKEERGVKRDEAEDADDPPATPLGAIKKKAKTPEAPNAPEKKKKKKKKPVEATTTTTTTTTTA